MMRDWSPIDSLKAPEDSYQRYIVALLMTGVPEDSYQRYIVALLMTGFVQGG